MLDNSQRNISFSLKLKPKENIAYFFSSQLRIFKLHFYALFLNLIVAVDDYQFESKDVSRVSLLNLCKTMPFSCQLYS